MIDYLKQIYMMSVAWYSKKVAKKSTKNQIVFLMSFPDNNENLLEGLAKDNQVIVYYTNEKVINRTQLERLNIENHSLKTLKGLKKAINDVTQSKVTISDNYQAFLGGIQKNKERSIFQIWHATGAIKRFGLEDKQFYNRSKADQKRFQQVYDAFDYYIVASKKMGDVFKRSYGASEEQMLYLGFPRTDELFEETQQPSEDGKKIILYLPTYRENQTELPPINVAELQKEFGEQFKLVIKLHPHIQHLASDMSNDEFVTWQTEKTTDYWLKRADVLITDYSSVAFDYALIRPTGKLIFYWYDEASYEEVTGIQKNLKETLPGNICYAEFDIIEQIKEASQENLEKFNATWNTYNDGQVVKRIVEKIRELGD